MTQPFRGRSAIAFGSAASNLVAGDTSRAVDVFVRDLFGDAAGLAGTRLRPG